MIVATIDPSFGIPGPVLPLRTAGTPLFLSQVAAWQDWPYLVSPSSICCAKIKRLSLFRHILPNHVAAGLTSRV